MSTFSTSSRQKGSKPSVFYTFDFEMCFAPQRRALFDTFSTSQLPKVVRDRQFLTLLTWKCASRTTACTFSTSQLPKVVRSWGALYILTWKCASRHNGVHFFDIATSKSRPTLRCFVHFDLEMCFAPQRRALFRHRNFQKSSDAEVFCAFWLGNVLRATTACNFSSLLWPAGSAPAALASLLSTLLSHKSLEKQVFRDFPTFSRICIFFLLTLSLSHLLSSNLPLLSASPLLCFSYVHIVEVWLLNFLR